MIRKLHQPAELRNSANVTIARWFVTQAKMMILALPQPATEVAAGAAAALWEHLTLIRHYLDHNMPKCKLINGAMSQSAVTELTRLDWYFNKSILQKNNELIASDVNITGRMIEILFADKLMGLHLIESDLAMFHETFCSKSYMLTSLVDLKIETSIEQNNKPEGLENNIISMIKELKNLKYLAILSFCTDSILSCIASNCPLIEELDLSYPGAGVTDRSMEIISQLRNLRIVKINGASNVTERGIRTLLLTCVNIEHIGFVSRSQEISRALNRIAADVTNSTKTFSLTTYRSENDTLEQLATIVRMCPRIQHLSVGCPADQLFFPRGHHQKNIFAIKGFIHLKELVLRNCSFYDNKVDEMLQSVGCNLTSLSFEGVAEINLKALIHISQTCPNLQSVSFNACKFKWGQSLNADELNVPIFTNLKFICLDWSGNLKFPSSDLASEISFTLLSNCLNVETILVKHGLWITEQTMSRILDKNPLRNLRLLQIGDFSNTHVAITAAILDRIVENCVRSPRIIEYKDWVYV